VYLSFNDEDGKYGGYWDLGPDGPAALEECPRTASAVEAVRWGRERAPVVMIRPEDDQGRYYWAGVEPPTGEFAVLPVWRDPGDIR
jgi:hypothetical protein